MAYGPHSYHNLSYIWLYASTWSLAIRWGCFSVAGLHNFLELQRSPLDRVLHAHWWKGTKKMWDSSDMHGCHLCKVCCNCCYVHFLKWHLAVVGWNLKSNVFNSCIYRKILNIFIWRNDIEYIYILTYLDKPLQIFQGFQWAWAHEKLLPIIYSCASPFQESVFQWNGK